jgi:hypothetical protein
MKVALCISGQPRSVESGWESLKVIIENNNPDVFVHTWWDDTYLDEGVPTSHMGTETNIHKDTLRVIEDLYNPISMVVDPPKDVFDGCDNELRRDRIVNIDVSESSNYIYNSSSMWWSLKQSIELKKGFEVDNRFLYDVVIRARFDLFVDKFLDFSKTENRIKKNTLYVPCSIGHLFSSRGNLDEFNKYYGVGTWEQYLKYYRVGTPDQCYFGDSNSLDVCGSLYDNIDIMLKEIPDLPFSPEVLQSKHLENNKVNINTMVNIDTDLLRGR